MDHSYGVPDYVYVARAGRTLVGVYKTRQRAEEVVRSIDGSTTRILLVNRVLLQ